MTTPVVAQDAKGVERIPQRHADAPDTTSDDQRWYWASATYKAVVVGDEHKRHLWQRIVFIFRAEVNNAKVVAVNIAQSKEHEYKNSKGKDVRWTFQEVNQIESLFDQQPQDGTEVYWHFFEKVDKSANH